MAQPLVIQKLLDAKKEKKEGNDEKEKENEKGKEKGESEEVKKNGDIDVDVNARDEAGLTALHYIKGSIECVEILLGQDAHVNAMDTRGRTPLHVAAEGGYLRTVDALLAKGADPNGGYFDSLAQLGQELTPPTPLAIACKTGNMRIVETLLHRGADYNIGAPTQDGNFSEKELFDLYPLAIACQVWFTSPSLMLCILCLAYLIERNNHRQRALI